LSLLLLLLLLLRVHNSSETSCQNTLRENEEGEGHRLLFRVHFIIGQLDSWPSSTGRKCGSERLD